jgi:bla regulator protein blaR1
MNTLMLFETFASLAVQVSLLIGLTAWAIRRRFLGANEDTCWASLHVCILLLTIAAFLFPHVRLVTWSDLDSSIHGDFDTVCVMCGRVVVLIWFAGTALRLIVNSAGVIRVTSFVRRAKRDETIQRELLANAAFAKAMPIGAEVRLVTNVVSPFCWQFHRPVIVLPDVVRDFPASEQAAILRHELAHLRLQHPLHLFLQRIVEAIYWFHPLVWWASLKAAAAREFRCDRESVSSRTEVADFLRSMLRLIESKVKRAERLLAGVGFLEGKNLLSRRTQALIDRVDHLDRSHIPLHPKRFVLLGTVAVVMCSLIWLPVNPNASRRAEWSPWPTWTAAALDATGVTVRDYEVDGHRLALESE